MRLPLTGESANMVQTRQHLQKRAHCVTHCTLRQGLLPAGLETERFCAIQLFRSIQDALGQTLAIPQFRLSITFC